MMEGERESLKLHNQVLTNYNGASHLEGGTWLVGGFWRTTAGTPPLLFLSRYVWVDGAAFPGNDPILTNHLVCLIRYPPCIAL